MKYGCVWDYMKNKQKIYSKIIEDFNDEKTFYEGGGWNVRLIIIPEGEM